MHTFSNPERFFDISIIEISGLYLGRITSGKRVGAQNKKRPNRNIQEVFKTRKKLVSLHKTKVKQMTPKVYTDILTKEILCQKRFSSC